MGVEKTIITEGNGPQPNKGQVISMHYTGWLKDTSKPNSRGSKFDSSHDHPGGAPLDSPIGVGRLIKGWDEAVPTMKVGEKAVFDISSDFAYGSQAIGDIIPANSDLIL